MKKINLIIMAAVALFAISCDKVDSVSSEPTNTYDVEGEKYVGELAILGTVQEDIAFYIDTNDDGSIDITMPGVSFMEGLMPYSDMALLSIPSNEDGTYYASESQMVSIEDRLPLINSVIQSITEVKAEMTPDSTISISFDCAISTTAMGDMTVTVTYDGVKDGYVAPEPSFTLDNDEGFYLTSSSGAILLADAAVTYYQGDNTIVIDGFSYSLHLSTTTLPISGVTESTVGGMMTLTGDEIAVEYIFMTMDATGNIYDLTCEIIDGKAQMEFTISASMGGSGTASEYPCTFNGEITVEEGSYITED